MSRNLIFNDEKKIKPVSAGVSFQKTGEIIPEKEVTSIEKYPPPEGFTKQGKRLSIAVTEFIKKRPTSTAPTEKPETCTGKNAELQSSETYFSKTSTRYSKAIQGLEKQIKQIKTKLEPNSGENTTSNVIKKTIRFEVDENKVVPISDGIDLQYKTCTQTCQRYLNIEDFAQLFIDDITNEALVKTNIIKKETSTKVVEGVTYLSDSESSSTVSSEPYLSTFEWPTIENFTVEMGVNKILEYLSHWNFEEDWKYCVFFLNGKSDKTSDFYCYEAIFSIPCKQYPVPQATASIYFTIELSRVRPRHCNIQVYYNFEGRRLIHIPGLYKLQESWLFHIVDAKINFFKKIKF